jgi:hypothetical protein
LYFSKHSWYVTQNENGSYIRYYSSDGKSFLILLFLLSSPLIGNKIDREDREIPTHVGEDFAQRHSMYYLETSAKEAENVERLFMEIAAELMEVNICYIFKVCSIKLLLI